MNHVDILKFYSYLRKDWCQKMVTFTKERDTMSVSWASVHEGCFTFIKCEPKTGLRHKFIGQVLLPPSGGGLFQ